MPIRRAIGITVLAIVFAGLMSQWVLAGGTLAVSLVFIGWSMHRPFIDCLLGFDDQSVRVSYSGGGSVSAWSDRMVATFDYARDDDADRLWRRFGKEGHRTWAVRLSRVEQSSAGSRAPSSLLLVCSVNELTALIACFAPASVYFSSDVLRLLARQGNSSISPAAKPAATLPVSPSMRTTPRTDRR